jgi:two-component system cell cycle response regulator
MIDIDGFKLINDTYGHQVGDEVIISVANTLSNSLRITDLLARYGGDEFIVAIPELKSEYVLHIIELIRIAIQNLKFTVKYSAETISFSLFIGIAEYTGQSIEDLINQADKALYKSKITGRNKVSIYGAM